MHSTILAKACPFLANRLARSSACGDDDLPALLSAALAAKQRFKPDVITYSRKVFLPLTNLCRDYCGYCIFRRDPGDPGAHTMTPGRSPAGRARRRETRLHRSSL